MIDQSLNYPQINVERFRFFPKAFHTFRVQSFQDINQVALMSNDHSCTIYSMENV